jgi:rhodanese-related sulfurtransferase
MTLKKIDSYGLFIIIAFLTMSCKNVAEEKIVQNTVASEAPSQDIVKVLGVDEFSKRLQAVGDIQLIDVRTPQEVSEGHIPGAMNISITAEGFENSIDKLDRSRPVYVYCKSGGRSARAAKIMKDLGFKEIYDLDGGITSWMAAGKEVIQ